MPAIAYTVTATLPDDQTAREYVSWLASGHTDAVVKGGAASALIVRITEPATPIRVQTRYIFASREGFEHYLREVAPGLRAEGVSRFGGRATFERSVADVL